MKKSVLASIKPKYCELIASGKKTVEIRKNRPKIDVPFKCYIYCTLNGTTEIPMEEYFAGKWHKKKGKVVGEFICNDIINIFADEHCAYFHKTCLTDNEFNKYLNGLPCIKGWRISNLVIYDKPKELSEFGLMRPPQSWCYVEEINDVKEV